MLPRPRYDKQFDMDNIINQLEQLTGLTPTQLSKEFTNRGNTAPVDKKKLIEWQEGKSIMPSWVERVAAQWIIELWQNERNQCDVKDLWTTDSKYTQILSFLTMADIVSMVQKHKSMTANKPT